MIDTACQQHLLSKLEL